VRAETDFGVGGHNVLTRDDTEYAAKLQQCVDDGNALCFAVGFSMGSAVETAANNNAGTHFAIVDYAYASYPTNLRRLVFDEEQAGYLARRIGWQDDVQQRHRLVRLECKSAGGKIRRGVPQWCAMCKCQHQCDHRLHRHFLDPTLDHDAQNMMAHRRMSASSWRFHR